jgi:hypothetical protein
MTQDSANAKPLHLHSIESLLTELIGGGAVGVSKDGASFKLVDAASRSVLAWYAKNRAKWVGNVTLPDVEAIAGCVDQTPAVQAVAVVVAGSAKRAYRLKRVKAYRFAGLHVFGTANTAPEIFDYEVSSAITVFEGFNGAGKTSLLNAIVWCLTGMLLRPQRAPEKGEQDFEFDLLHLGDAEASSYKVCCLTPLPDFSLGKQSDVAIIADTWVELTFADVDGNVATPVRRSLSRTTRGKLQETAPDFSAMGLDSQALRIGTVIPALLPFSQVGSQSELGKAVAQLTGLAPLADLAKHARRAKERLAKDETKAREKEIEQFDEAFKRGLEDLTELANQSPELEINVEVPHPREGEATEKALDALTGHLGKRMANGLSAARSILGDNFEPEKNGPALESDVREARTAVEGLANANAARRMSALRKISAEDISQARKAIVTILEEARLLLEMAKSPEKSDRERLYAAVAQWYIERGHETPDFSLCPVCEAGLEDAVDAQTGKAVKTHLNEACGRNAGLVSQTLERWSVAAVTSLASQVAGTLATELRQQLSDEPFDLLHQALVDEVLADNAFKGALRPLAELTEAACNMKRKSAPPIAETTLSDLQKRLPGMVALQSTLARLDRALRTAEWGQANAEFRQTFFNEVVGRATDGTPPEATSLLGRLGDLERVLEDVEPMNSGIKLCKRMTDDVASRRAVEKRLLAYAKAEVALEECAKLGHMAEQQVAELQESLHLSTEAWRKAIYQAGYPNANHDLTSTTMSVAGEVEFRLGSQGASAPAQYVANASSLRATLIAFYLAYWEYLRQERGGLDLIVLDDPQELLDGDNKERLARAVVSLVGKGAQPVVTTHDNRFARHIVLECTAQHVQVEHRDIHPATARRPTITTSPSVLGVDRAKKAAIDSDWTDPGLAQDYAGRCREFIEARLGDFFDDAGKPATTTRNMKPTLGDFINDLRGAVRTGSTELFKARNVVDLAKDPGLDSRSPVYALLNKAHHASRASILPNEVHAVLNSLERLCDLVEGAHQDFRTYCRRELLLQPAADLAPLPLEQLGKFTLPIQPNLAAFVRGGAYGESQETEVETLSSEWFDGKAAFFLRTTNFGFASTIQGVAIVEAEATDVPDRSLVIARKGKFSFARRLHRAKAGGSVSLATETPDPRSGRSTLNFNSADVALHKVVGMLFHTDFRPANEAAGEADQVDLGTLLKRVKSAYRVKEESAVPLALEGQIALGGESLELTNLDRWIDHYVAVHLSDGTTLFKRVGKSLSGELDHLRVFDAIGGLGSSDVLAVGKHHSGVAQVESAVLILGVLYK